MFRDHPIAGSQLSVTSVRRVKGGQRRTKHVPRTRRLTLEPLEDRTLLALESIALSPLAAEIYFETQATYHVRVNVYDGVNIFQKALTVTLTDANDPPVAAADVYAAAEDTPTSVPAQGWVELASLPTARTSAMAGVINDQFYVVGGHAGTTGASAVLEAYDPATDSWAAKASAPQRKYGGTAGVIDGKLYVAGGWNWPLSGIPTSSLQIYDGASNSWSTGADMPTLSGCSVSGVIDGQLYVLTACNGYGGYQNLLHMYDPASNTWTAKAGSPHDHADGAAGVIDGKLYVAGGTDEGGRHAYLDAYDPATNSWSTLASLPVAINGAAGAVRDGKLYVMGGSDGASADTVYVYDPGSDTWSTTTSLNVARSGLVAGVIGEAIYTAGGSGPSAAVEGYLATGVLANDSDAHGGAPGENNLPLTAELVAGPGHAAAFTLHSDGSFAYTPAADYNGLDSFTYRAVDSLGGVSAAATVTITVNSVNDAPGAADDAYSVDEDTALSVEAASWNELSPMPTARGSAMAGVIGDRFYVLGGNAAGTGASDVMEAYDPAADTWTTMTSAPQRKYGGTADVIAGKLYVAGGWNWPLSGIPTSTLQIYDAASNTWSLGADMPILSGCSASGVVDGKLYVLTACDGWGGYKNYLHAYDPASNTWTIKAGSPHSHSNPAAGVIGGKLYVAGGWDDIGLTSHLDAYDPVTNSWSTRASLPVAVGGSAGVVRDGKLYVMGGSDGSDVSTVYVYDPATDVWSTDSPMNVARSALVAGAIGEVIYTAGGTGPLNTLEGLLATGVLANDSDEHGGTAGENNLPLTAELVAGPGHAAAFTLHSDGSFAYTPAADYNGLDSFTYRAVDSLGGASAAATVTLTVASVNDPPVAAADGPYVLEAGTALMLDGTGSSDPDADSGDAIVVYEWDLDQDGEFDDAVGARPTIPWATLAGLGVAYPADPATGLPTNTIRLRVRDSFGASGTASTTLSIYNNRPYAVLSAGPNPCACGQTVAFDGSGSWHGWPGREIIRYAWDFGDGSSYVETVGKLRTEPLTAWPRTPTRRLARTLPCSR